MKAKDLVRWRFRFCWPPQKYNWLYHEWNFTNRFGVHEKGIRVLGLEVANWNDDVDDLAEQMKSK